MTVTALERVAANTDVLRIDIDPIMHTTLAQAVPFVGLSAVQGAGFTGRNVVVAMIDTGVDTDNTDLSDDIIAQQCFCDRVGGTGCCPNGQHTQTGPGAAEDDNFHGSYTAGIVTRRGTIAPRGGAPDAKVVAVTVLDETGRGQASGALVASDWILNNRPDVQLVNMSFVLDNFTYDADCDDSGASARMYADAIDLLRTRGTPAFAAAGNNGTAPIYMNEPACVRNAISVAASYDNDPAVGGYQRCFFPTPRTDAAWCFSNADSKTDIFAPGVFITSLNNVGTTRTGNGTSASAPLVTACAATVLEANPTLTPFGIELALENAERIHDDRTDNQYPLNGLDTPRLDCMDALNQVRGGTGFCPSTPRAGCRRPPAGRAGTIWLKNYTSDQDSRDYLNWTWHKGAATTLNDYGNPLVDASYSFCLYRPTNFRLVVNLLAPAGGLCAGKPCWLQSFSSVGFTYADKLLSPSGISALRLRTGTEGKTKIRVTGKGINLRVPALPLIAPITAQLINQRTGACWEATYSAPLRNNAFELRSYSD